MWIVRLALRRPYTVVVLAVLILMFGALVTIRMNKDIFPTIDIPVVIVVWAYPGLSAEDMERRVVLIAERAMSTTVNGISRVESQSIVGIGTIRVYFEQGTDIGSAVAQITSVSNTVTRSMPPGITPPVVIQYNASNVPVAQLTLTSPTLTEQQIYDHALNFIRVRLFTIPGVAIPAPYGGKQRQVMIDIDPDAVAARGQSPQDVVNAVLASNIITPAGSIRIGTTEYDVTINSSPERIEELAKFPLTLSDGAVVRLGDVARVHDGFAIQQNVVRVNGKRATYLAILKKASASTLAVVDATREAMPSIKAAAPEGLELRLDFDQSVFVRAAIAGVVREGVISAVLVSLMVLVFLGSWRSVVIVGTSIPLSIAVGLIGLYALGQTINVMTLGGLALAIGMLVDDATVEIENINRNRHANPELSMTGAILNAASQIAIPALAATSTICVVFFPVVLLTGPARYLFTALALSVVLSMGASYLLSRTLVPALSDRLLPKEALEPEGDGWWARANRRRDRLVRQAAWGFYGGVLDLVLAHRVFAVACAIVIAAIGFGLAFAVGTDFFPSVDAGQMRLHVRAPLGLRIEDTEHLVGQVEAEMRKVIPADEIQTIDDNIGIPISYNLAFVQTDNLGGQDADVLIALAEHHGPTIGYQRTLRQKLAEQFPGTTFYFQPADIVTQVLDFGLPAPIDVEVEGPKFEALIPIAQAARRDPQDPRRGRRSHRAGARSSGAAHRRRSPARGAGRADAARCREQHAGVVVVELARVAIVLAVAGDGGELFGRGADPAAAGRVGRCAARDADLAVGRGAGVGRHRRLERSRPLQTSVNPFTPRPGVANHLGDVAQVTPSQDAALISHDLVQRVLEVRLSVDGRDLGSVADAIDRVIAGLKLPKNVRIHVRGQSDSMRTSFHSLGLGVVIAAALVYLLLVVLFQSFIDPLVIVVAIPGALVGALLMLALTGTTLNVESLMGAIMSIGVATSNSILLVSFANEIREEDPDKIDAIEAARRAGRTRLRPVLMTALAMILGMLPMALAFGEGGEQNAPLARAVIGGLLVATFVTLFLVPTAYTLLRRTPSQKVELARRVDAARKETAT